MGIVKGTTRRYHSQSNGVVEMGNWDLGDALRAMLLEEVDNWDFTFSCVMRFIRAMLHSGTEETPNFLILGRELQLPNQLVSGWLDSDVESTGTCVLQGSKPMQVTRLKTDELFSEKSRHKKTSMM